MNIVNRLTLRNLRLNRKRTLVTIIGIIISTAMITAVATFAVSFMDLMQRSEIASSGNWHLLFSDISRDQATQIRDGLCWKKALLLAKSLIFWSKNMTSRHLKIMASTLSRGAFRKMIMKSSSPSRWPMTALSLL